MIKPSLTILSIVTVVVSFTTPVLAQSGQVSAISNQRIAWSGWDKISAWWKKPSSKPITNPPASVKPVVQPAVLSNPISTVPAQKNIVSKPSITKSVPKNSKNGNIKTSTAGLNINSARPVEIVKTPNSTNVTNKPSVVDVPASSTPSPISVKSSIENIETRLARKYTVDFKPITNSFENVTPSILPTKFFSVRDMGGITKSSHYIMPTDINNNDEVVGSAVAGDGDGHGFYWKDGKMSDLKTLGGIGGTSAYAINDKGQIVGYSRYSFTGKVIAGLDQAGMCRAVLWENGSIKDLGAINGFSRGGSVAYGLNNNGIIVGESEIQPTVKDVVVVTHAFMYSDGVMSDIGSLFGDSRANAVNDDGVIVGQSVGADNKMHAVMWKNGILSDLSLNTPFEGGNSYARKISNDGTIIGYGGIPMQDGYHEDGRQFIWKNGIMTLFDNIQFFNGINSNGQIAVINGILDGSEFKPVNEQGTVWYVNSKYLIMDINDNGNMIAQEPIQDGVGSIYGKLIVGES